MPREADGQKTAPATASQGDPRPGGRWVAIRWAAHVQRALDRVGRREAARRRPSLGEQHLVHYASHALLSPLTACRWQLELLDDDPRSGARWSRS